MRIKKLPLTSRDKICHLAIFTLAFYIYPDFLSIFFSSTNFNLYPPFHLIFLLRSNSPVPHRLKYNNFRRSLTLNGIMNFVPNLLKKLNRYLSLIFRETIAASVKLRNIKLFTPYAHKTNTFPLCHHLYLYTFAP